MTLLENDPTKLEKPRQIISQSDEFNNLHKKFEEAQKQNLVLVQQEEMKVKEKLIQIEKQKIELVKPLPIGELIKARDSNFTFIKQTVNNMLTTEIINAKS